MLYEKDIFIVLKEAGATGLKVRKIVRHIFNAHNSFFNPTSEDEIAGAVQRYLAYHSKAPGNTIERLAHGTYRLNMKSPATRQLLRKYTDNTTDASGNPQPKDQSLNLFW